MTSFDSFEVGDQVYCLAWLGKPFEIVAKDNVRGILSLQGALENIPQGAQVDIFTSTTWMITREKWDQIWYWPDRAGETYQQVFERFVSEHSPGGVVTGYQIEGPNPLEPFSVTPERAMAFRILKMDDLGILIQPVAGTRKGVSGTLEREAKENSDIDWLPVGPMAAAVLKMTDYRWSLSYGDMVLNWQDFI